MRATIASLKKEWMEQVRSGRLMILGILFVLFGIMNPAIAKLTPWLLETLSDSLAESGMTVTTVSVDALTSWTQFFKNIPMALIAFILLESSILTREYQSGTLVLTLTKGLDRYKVIVSKTIILILIWSLGYWLCFGITYGYNAYFWDNGIAKHLAVSVFSSWLIGIFAVVLTILFSVLSSTNANVLLGTGGVFLASYLIGMIPKLKEYVPTVLLNGTNVVYGIAEAESLTKSMIVTAILCIMSIAISIPIFNKKHI
jgi:ABC-2 type transport system permease protein